MSKWYCDASYNHQCKVGVIGYKSGSSPITLESVYGAKNTELEFIALDRVLSVASDGDTVYSDCQRIIELILKSNPKYQYQSDLLRRLEQVSVSVLKIDGHKPSRDKDENDMQFSLVDNAVRKHLRTLCK